MSTNPELSTEEKVAILRELCQGYGLISPESFIEHEDRLRQIVDTRSKNLDEMFQKAGESMTPGKYKDAFLNALWGRDRMNLTERRTDYITKKGDVTYRTLINREQEGAEIFLKFLEAEARSRKVLHWTPDEADDEDGPVSPSDVEALRRRVTELESVVYLLDGVIRNAYYSLSDLMRQNPDKKEWRDWRERWMTYTEGKTTEDGLDMMTLIGGLPGRFSHGILNLSDEQWAELRSPDEDED